MAKALAIIGFTLALEAGFLLHAAVPARPVATSQTAVAGQPPAGGFAMRGAAPTAARPRS